MQKYWDGKFKLNMIEFLYKRLLNFHIHTQKVLTTEEGDKRAEVTGKKISQ
jgi:hypothetical protein